MNDRLCKTDTKKSPIRILQILSIKINENIKKIKVKRVGERVTINATKISLYISKC